MNGYPVLSVALALAAMLSLCVPLGGAPQPKAREIVSGPMASATGAAAARKPQGPCGEAPYPNYPALDAGPEVVLWTSDTLGKNWRPPYCVGWPTNSATLVVGLAGRFDDSHDGDAMLAKIGAISSLRDVRYWSVTDKRWNTLFLRVTALDGPDPHKQRGDFSVAEMRALGDRYFLAADNRSDEDAVWRLRIKEAGERRIIVETTNVSAFRWLFLPLIGAGDIQTSYILEREPGGTWTLYSLTRVLYISPLLGYLASDASYINRATGFYRHYAGASAERESPPQIAPSDTSGRPAIKPTMQ
jgi:hypothetical protein